MSLLALRHPSRAGRFGSSELFSSSHDVIVGDLLGRAAVGALFAMLSMNLWADYLKTGRLTGLLFLLSEALVVVLTIIRRPARNVDRSFLSRALTMISLLAPTMMRATSKTPLVPDAVTAMVSTVGVAIVILGKVTIGRSFGIVPANRGIVATGPYNVVRHPIYAGYLLSHAATLVAYPGLRNACIILAGDICLVLRALAEERMLSSDREYQVYCGRVAWHLVPGVF
jgi:protein-S-isoprenylcysteine O-methyltransferase Ste14